MARCFFCRDCRARPLPAHSACTCWDCSIAPTCNSPICKGATPRHPPANKSNTFLMANSPRSHSRTSHPPSRSWASQRPRWTAAHRQQTWYQPWRTAVMQGRGREGAKSAPYGWCSIEDMRMGEQRMMRLGRNGATEDSSCECSEPEDYAVVAVAAVLPAAMSLLLLVLRPSLPPTLHQRLALPACTMLSALAPAMTAVPSSQAYFATSMSLPSFASASS